MDLGPSMAALLTTIVRRGHLSHIHCFISGSKLAFSTNLFHQSASTLLDYLLGLYWTGLTLLNGFSFLVIFSFLFWVVR